VEPGCTQIFGVNDVKTTEWLGRTIGKTDAHD
jgi:hypothetical protein